MLPLFSSLYRSRLVVLALTAAALALTVPSSVTAQPAEASVDALIREGLSLRRQGHDEQAYALFERAWNASHTPRARAQMGLAAQALGRWPDADRLLREALSATSDAWVTERRTVLTRSLAEIDAHLGLLEVRCNLDGAEVRIDGTARGTTPLLEPLRLPAGTVAIQLVAPGHLDATRLAVLTAGGTTREQIDLVALPRPVATPAVVTPIAQPPIEPGTVMVLPPRPPPHVDDPDEGRRSLHRTLAFTAGGVAVAGVVMGGVFLALRNGAANDFNTRRTDSDESNNCVQGSTVAACVEAESSISTQTALSTVGFVVGGVAAVTSAALFLTMPARREGARASLRGCSAGASSGGLGASCAFAF
jgi:PEGA domain